VEVCNLFKNGTYNTADLDAIIAMKKKDPLKVREGHELGTPERTSQLYMNNELELIRTSHSTN
jgi:hypothetical protein